MATPEFKKLVLETVQHILRSLSGEVLFMCIKPIVNLAMPHLEKQLEQKPEEVYEWLKIAQTHINRSIAVYESDQKTLK